MFAFAGKQRASFSRTYARPLEEIVPGAVGITFPRSRKMARVRSSLKHATSRLESSPRGSFAVSPDARILPIQLKVTRCNYF